MRSALGVIQLSKLKDANRARESLVNRYIENLKDINGLSIPFQNLENITSSYHIFVILLDRYVDREEIMLKLKEVGVQSSIHYPHLESLPGHLKIIGAKILGPLFGRRDYLAKEGGRFNFLNPLLFPTS